MTTNYPNRNTLQRNMGTGLRLAMVAGILLGATLPVLPVAAAEPPLIESIDMSVQVGQSLVEVIELIGAEKLDEAATALQPLRDAHQQGRLSDYEASRVLQLAVNLDIVQGKHLEATQDSEALLQTRSLSPDERTSAQLMLGKLHLQLENWSAALEHLQPGNEMQGGNNQETLYLLGLAHYRLQQPELAIPYLEQAVALDAAKANEQMYSLLGLIYVNAKDNPKAIATYEALLRAIANPVQGESYHSTLAQLYLQAGDRNQARATLQQLISKYPRSARLSDYQQRLAALN